MTDHEPRDQRTPEQAEDEIAAQLMQCAKLLVDVQEATQRDTIDTLRAVLAAGHGLEIQVRVSALENCIRIVTLDAAGAEWATVRRIDLQPVAGIRLC